MKITIGKKNCINDTTIYLDETIPEINKKLVNTFADQDYAGMKKQIARLKAITADLSDMVDELIDLKK